MAGLKKCAIEFCREAPCKDSYSTLCFQHFFDYGLSPECKVAREAGYRGDDKALDIEITMAADFVRRVEAEKRNHG